MYNLNRHIACCPIMNTPLQLWSVTTTLRRSGQLIVHENRLSKLTLTSAEVPKEVLISFLCSCHVVTEHVHLLQGQPLMLCCEQQAVL